MAKPFEQGRVHAIEQLDLDASDHVLIVGCGTGSDLDHLPAGVTVSAIDLVPAMVQRAANRTKKRDIDCDVQVGNAQALPYETDTFDVVLLHLILSVVPDPTAVVTETARVLDADGRVSIFDKFLPGETPSLPRRLANPLARVLFSDLTRRLDMILADAPLEITTQEWILGDLYTVALARPVTERERSLKRPQEPRPNRG
ncbi:MAG: class I SAM-dependent methyltransferase [Halobacteriales archaeon]